ncbi:acyltransferase [Francisella philomiragia]|nr:acyltransferase [Francisella philomiragia]MBK2273896.1 acyltransferase [Francisella philomiragia]MBK2277767.1 acyltransferase [Francisella philomiragia]MBK2281685.1 acyltransferase [Francisella philomiragia]MBK2283634.1 acyltransferase [Francisella philomiragia]
MGYRKDIDGLRAFAVIFVILFHLDISWVKSGFLGVDIFFVISGFLITSIVIRDLENNSFSMKSFYLRRMRRILPPLIIVLIFSTLFAFLILLPQDLNDYVKTLISAIASLSNIYFFKYLSFGYFTSDSSIIPLLHTWSLGVEEQFYTFWPLLLVFIFNLGISWKRNQEISFYKKIMVLSIIFFLLSIFCFRYLSYFQITNFFNAQEYYYFPLTRAFELLFGCILGIYLTRKESKIDNVVLLNILALLSLVLMLYPILFKSSSYPSNWMIMSCLGATLFIYIGSGYNVNFSMVHRIFSLRPIVSIGLISYSLYLWHWPIIAYVNYLSIDKTVLIKIAIFLVSIILAMFTYFFVEKPFRYKFKLSFVKTFLLMWLLPLLLTIGLAISLKPYHKIDNIDAKIFTATDKQNILQVSDLLNQWSKYRCYMQNDGTTPAKYLHRLADRKHCLIGDLNSDDKVNIALLGDSHGNRTAFMLDVWLKELGAKAYVSNFSSGPYLHGMSGDYKFRVDMIDEMIREKSYKYYVLSAYWEAYSLQKLSEAIQEILSAGSIPVIILDTPVLNMTTYKQKVCVDALTTKSDCFFKLTEKQIKTDEYIEGLKNKFKSLIIINPSKVLNENGRYPTSVDDVQIYGTGDKNHITYEAAYLIAKLYQKKYGNPLQQIV